MKNSIEKLKEEFELLSVKEKATFLSDLASEVRGFQHGLFNEEKQELLLLKEKTEFKPPVIWREWMEDDGMKEEAFEEQLGTINFKDKDQMVEFFRLSNLHSHRLSDVSLKIDWKGPGLYKIKAEQKYHSCGDYDVWNFIKE